MANEFCLPRQKSTVLHYFYYSLCRHTFLARPAFLCGALVVARYKHKDRDQTARHKKSTTVKCKSNTDLVFTRAKKSTPIESLPPAFLSRSGRPCASPDRSLLGEWPVLESDFLFLQDSFACLSLLALLIFLFSKLRILRPIWLGVLHFLPLPAFRITILTVRFHGYRQL